MVAYQKWGHIIEEVTYQVILFVIRHTLVPLYGLHTELSINWQQEQIYFLWFPTIKESAEEGEGALIWGGASLILGSFSIDDDNCSENISFKWIPVFSIFAMFITICWKWQV